MKAIHKTKALVIEWLPEYQCHLCATEDGNKIRVDVEVCGKLPIELRGKALVGKRIEWERTHAFISIAHGVSICDAEVL